MGELGVGVVGCVWGVFLFAAPLVPNPENVHGGMLAVFSGLVVLAISLTFLVAGSLMKQGHRFRWRIQLLPTLTILSILGFLSQ